MQIRLDNVMAAIGGRAWRLTSMTCSFRLTLCVLWAGIALAVGCSRSEPLPDGTKAKPSKVEVKLFVSAADVPQALKALRLEEHTAKTQLVCFFDTSDRVFEANNLILRARESEDGNGESTVKIRALATPEDLSDAERAIPVEQDWTNETEPTMSRSVSRGPLVAGLVAQAAAGQTPVRDLFDASQRALVESRVKDFRWDSLRRYGPIETLVWTRQWKLAGLAEDVTVELWHLRRDGQSEEILEVSAKGKAASESEARELARRFFDAARSAGLGSSANQTKTTRTMQFYEPGR